MDTKIVVKQPRELNVFLALSHPIGLALFRYIASNGGWYREDLISSLECSKKQFYNNMHRLMELGLVRRGLGFKYSLSAYGRVVYNALQVLDGSIKYKDPMLLLEENREKYTPETWEKMAEMLIPNATIRQLAFD